MNYFRSIFLLDFWKNQNRYIGLLCFLLSFTVSGYLYFHNPKRIDEGYEYTKINQMVKLQISSLIESNVDTIQKRYFLSQVTVNKIISCIESNYPEWDENNKQKVAKNLVDLNNLAAISYINNEIIKVGSFFWLHGSWAYLEVVFWSIMGVLSSLLYSITEIIRNNREHSTFHPNHIPSHIAKIFYAPIVSLIIIFGYDYVEGMSSTNLNLSKGIIIVSFIIGFYSSRAMEFLNRIKEILLPYTSQMNLESKDIQKSDSLGTSKKNLLFLFNVSENNLPENITRSQITEKISLPSFHLIEKETESEFKIEEVINRGNHIFELRNIPEGRYKINIDLPYSSDLIFTYAGEIDLSKHIFYEIELTKEDILVT